MRKPVVAFMYLNYGLFAFIESKTDLILITVFVISIESRFTGCELMTRFCISVYK